MFNVIAGWFVVGMFVAGSWIVVGAFLPAREAGKTGRGRPNRSA